MMSLSITTTHCLQSSAVLVVTCLVGLSKCMVAENCPRKIRIFLHHKCKLEREIIKKTDLNIQREMK